MSPGKFFTTLVTKMRHFWSFSNTVSTYLKVVAMYLESLSELKPNIKYKARVINSRLKWEGKLSLCIIFLKSWVLQHLELAKESPWHLHIQQLKVLHTFLYGSKKASFFRKNLSLLWFKDKTQNILITLWARSTKKGWVRGKLEKDVLPFCNVSLGSKLRLKCFVFPMGR